MSFSILQNRFAALPEYQQKQIEGIVQGVAVGTTVSVLINPLEKINTRLQVSTVKEPFFKTLFQAPFKGLPVAVINSVSKNVLLFGLIPCYRQLSDRLITDQTQAKIAADLFSALTLSYLLAPFQVMKARLYTQDHKRAVEIYREIPKGRKVKTLLSGSSTTALKYTFYYPFFFFTADRLAKKLEGIPLPSNAVAGSIAGLGSAFITYPLDLIAKKQKCCTRSASLFQIASNIHTESGFRGYFNGFAKASLPRFAIAGAATQTIISYVSHTFNEWKETKI